MNISTVPFCSPSLLTLSPQEAAPQRKLLIDLIVTSNDVVGVTVLDNIYISGISAVEGSGTSSHRDLLSPPASDFTMQSGYMKVGDGLADESAGALSQSSGGTFKVPSNQSSTPSLGERLASCMSKMKTGASALRSGSRYEFLRDLTHKMSKQLEVRQRWARKRRPANTCVNFAPSHSCRSAKATPILSPPVVGFETTFDTILVLCVTYVLSPPPAPSTTRAPPPRATATRTAAGARPQVGAPRGDVVPQVLPRSRPPALAPRGK